MSPSLNQTAEALPSGEGLHGGTDEEPLSGEEEEEDGGEDA